MSKDWLRLLLCAALSLVAGTATDQKAAAEAPVPCGSIYTAAAGDTLYLLAMRAYGRGVFQPIHDANRDSLPDPRKVAIGDLLLIPCLDGTGPRTLVEARELALAGDVEERLKAPVGSIAVARPTRRPGERQIRFLTGSEFAPFADTELEDGRLITKRMQQAVRKAAPEQEFRIYFINDLAEHQSTLLRDGAFDVGFPWFRPDCSRTKDLTEELRMRCDEFEFSDPIFDVSIGFYARAGDPLTGAASKTGRSDALSGKTICRPRENFPLDLEHSNLMAAGISIEIEDTATDCFTRLMAGQVDIVTLLRHQANDEIRRAGMSGRVIQITSLASRQTLHAVVQKSNPDGPAYLEIINAGFASLIASRQ
jgi:polar amino acid transport system substrate-binding protein